MTPGARVAAAIALLDRIATGEAAEPVLTNWARGARYAGSGDRAAVRDLVYDALRRRRSYAALGGGDDGRGLMLGRCRAAGDDPATLFNGQGHAPPPLTPAELAAGRAPRPGGEALDVPDWVLARARDALGVAAEAELDALRVRAPLGLRVNLRKLDRGAARQRLAAAGIDAVPSNLSSSALVVAAGDRRLRQEGGLAAGLWDLQDPASQAVSDAVPMPLGGRMLDYCAGGGGKTLAVAARTDGAFFAYDARPERMADLPARAARAGVSVSCLTDLAAVSAAAPFDVVLVDAPCSGSGSWRRDPDGKWRLTPARLAELTQVQDAILAAAAPLVAPQGTLVYATCSFLREENEDRVAAFRVAHPDWQLTACRRLPLAAGGDAFGLAVLTRAPG